MAQERQSQPTRVIATWRTRNVCVLAVSSLWVGLVAGYLQLGGSAAMTAKPAVAAVVQKTPGAHPPMTIAAWQEFPCNNPNLDRKATVEQMIAEAKSQPASGKASSTTGP